MKMDDVRKTIWLKTNGRCAYCGTFINPQGNWQIEHMIPKIQNGSNNIDNLIMSCVGCNHSKGGKTAEEYKEYIIAQVEKELFDGLLFKRYGRKIIVDLLTKDQSHNFILSLEKEFSNHINPEAIKFYYERLANGEEDLD
jgi:hypothetical protein